MRRILVILGSAALVVVAALIIVPFLVPASAVKGELAAYVKQVTGRELAVADGGRFQLFPSAGVTFEGVRLSGPDGNAEQPFLRADAVTAELSLISLVGGGIAFNALTLDNAIIDLRRNTGGTVNWEFSGMPGTTAVPTRVRRVSYAAAASGEMRLGIRQVALRDSIIRYHAPDSGSPVEITDTNMVLRMPDMESPATLTGHFDLRGRRLDVEAGLETPGRLNRGEPAKLVAELTSDFGTLNFDGDVTGGEAGVLAGALTARSDAPAEVFALAGANAAPAIASANLEADLEARDSGIELSDLRAVLDDMTATGTLSVATSGRRPALSGRLDFDTLKIEAFAIEPVLAARDSADAASTGLWTAHAAPGDDIELDLAGLDALEADLALTAETLTRKSLTGRDAAARARLQDGALAVDLSRLSLYDGSATGDFELSGHEGVPVVSATVEVSGVDGLPLLSDASSFDWLSGKLDGRVKIASGGATVNELRSRLQGKAQMRMRDGALQGLDLPGILARVQAGELSEFRRREGDRTDFSRLQANWAIRKGVGQTEDLQLEGPLVSATGSGKVNFRRETLDLRLKSRVTPRMSDGGDAEAIELPIRMQGDWAKPAIYPDVEEALKEPEKSLGAAKNFGKAVEKLTGGEVSEDDFKNAVEGLFGKNKD
ncbi:MAG: AsmA family protein [Dichotomicrobium sp.]